VFAVLFDAVGIQAERMVCNLEAVTLGYFDLQGFDLFIVKLLYAAAV
jgi:hypothetical protein